MARSRDEVVAAIQATFPESSRARVLELLDRYGVESYERERERVQLAILKLSGGSEEKLREFVAVAKRDYCVVLGGESGRSAIGYAGETGTSKKDVRKVWDQAAGRLLNRGLRG